MDNSLRQKLLDAHVQHEMQRLNSENIEATVRVEVEEIFEYFLDKKIEDVASGDKIKERFKWIIENYSLNDSGIEFLKKLVKMNYEFLDGDVKKLNEIIDKDEFLKSLKDAVGLEKARKKAIHFIVHSSAYSRMMTGIIYAAIKDFLQQNPLTKNNPVASSFMKFGQDFLNNLPGMQGNFDATIMEFLRNSLSGRIEQSEELISNEMNSTKNIDDFLNELWNYLESMTLKEIQNLIPQDEIYKYIDRIPSFWDHLKSTKFFEKLVNHNIDEFISKYGKKTFREMLGELGLESNLLVDQISKLYTPFIDNDEFKSYLKLRFEKRYREFYFSFEG